MIYNVHALIDVVLAMNADHPFKTIIHFIKIDDFCRLEKRAVADSPDRASLRPLNNQVDDQQSA
jgi:hypothetical protein